MDPIALIQADLTDLTNNNTAYTGAVTQKGVTAQAVTDATNADVAQLATVSDAAAKVLAAKSKLKADIDAAFPDPVPVAAKVETFNR